MTSSSPRAIIQIETAGRNFSNVNYSRRMYAVIRKYTPDVIEGKRNECYAELTGLRTFFKMSYKELATCILSDLKKELGLAFTIRVATVKSYEDVKSLGKKKSRSISTYKELNPLSTDRAYASSKNNTALNLRRKLTVPFLGGVK